MVRPTNGETICSISFRLFCDSFSVAFYSPRRECIERYERNYDRLYRTRGIQGLDAINSPASMEALQDLVQLDQSERFLDELSRSALTGALP